jgi:hypothetical protein
MGSLSAIVSIPTVRNRSIEPVGLAGSSLTTLPQYRK